MDLMEIIFPIACLLAGIGIGWLLLRGRATAAESRAQTQAGDLQAARAEMEALRIRNAEMQAGSAAEKRATEEKLQALQDAERRLSENFQALSAQALKSNNQAFLDLAQAKLAESSAGARADLEKRQQAIAELLSPVRTSLEKMDGKLQGLETAREGAYRELREQVRGLGEGQQKLQQETNRLVTALRTPAVRGRWGEIQLQRVAEMAGMLEYCDFVTQATIAGEEGRLRPDMIVRLPGGKSIVVDAKAPLTAYLYALEATDEEARRGHLRDHAAQVRTHLQQLGRKSYSQQFERAPDFVVLFLPGESFFSAALENDPSLIEFGLDQNVILATPTTLIALLRTAAYGWQQEALARNAAEISALGKELYKRIAGMQEKWNEVGKSLNRAVRRYNEATTTLETRVMVSARKFDELKAAPGGIEIDAGEPVETTVRMLAASPGALGASQDSADVDPFADFRLVADDEALPYGSSAVD
jgi:DNA recombination protein RmuC